MSRTNLPTIITDNTIVGNILISPSNIPLHLATTRFAVPKTTNIQTIIAMIERFVAHNSHCISDYIKPSEEPVANVENNVLYTNTILLQLPLPLDLPDRRMESTQSGPETKVCITIYYDQVDYIVELNRLSGSHRKLLINMMYHLREYIMRGNISEPPHIYETLYDRFPLELAIRPEHTQGNMPVEKSWVDEFM